MKYRSFREGFKPGHFDAFQKQCLIEPPLQLCFAAEKRGEVFKISKKNRLYAGHNHSLSNFNDQFDGSTYHSVYFRVRERGYYDKVDTGGRHKPPRDRDGFYRLIDRAGAYGDYFGLFVVLDHSGNRARDGLGLRLRRYSQRLHINPV